MNYIMLIGEVADTTIDFKPYVDALASTITPAQVLTILASVLGVGMSFFLMWLGVRKATKGFTSAVATGRIRL